VRSRLLLTVCFLVLLTVVGLVYARKNMARPVPPAHSLPAGAAVIERVSFAHEDVGAYHNTGPRGRPAWWISRDAAVVKAFGNGNNGVVLVRCNCGLTIRMLGQKIDTDGMVAPSIWHDVPECGYHVWGRFADWDNGVWDTAATQP